MNAHGLLLASREPWTHHGIIMHTCYFLHTNSPLGVEMGLLRLSGEGMFVEWREIESVVLPRRPLVANR